MTTIKKRVGQMLATAILLVDELTALNNELGMPEKSTEKKDYSKLAASISTKRRARLVSNSKE